LEIWGSRTANEWLIGTYGRGDPSDPSVVAGALHQAGLKLGVLPGAAGILTVAIGFASQTSASNLISGLFVIAERPFVVGDIIRVAETTGEVLSVDLLSVKIRTFDNLYVRIPNEGIIREHGIEIPCRHRTLYADDVAVPFPVKLVGGQADPRPAE
jgi:hypothetical protein